MTVKEILEKKLKGDYVVVGAIIGKTPDNVRQALNNVKSKNHKPVVEAISRLIESREQLING